MGKLLVVDDDRVVRRLIRRVFEEAGYEVIETADGQGVSQLVQTERPALVLMDIHMPHLNGLTVLNEIMEADPGMAVIMISGDDDLRVAKRAIEIGACDYITKPIDLRSLQMAVRAYSPLAR
jgi:DNA-binding response OmpR family regulator